MLCLGMHILGLHSISRDVADNVSDPRRLDPTMELITYSFVLYLPHGSHDVKCKRSIRARAEIPLLRFLTQGKVYILLTFTY